MLNITHLELGPKFVMPGTHRVEYLIGVGLARAQQLSLGIFFAQILLMAVREVW